MRKTDYSLAGDILILLGISIVGSILIATISNALPLLAKKINSAMIGGFSFVIIGFLIAGIGHLLGMAIGLMLILLGAMVFSSGAKMFG